MKIGNQIKKNYKTKTMIKFSSIINDNNKKLNNRKKPKIP